MKALKTMLALATIAGFVIVAQAGAAEARTRCVGCNAPIVKTNVKTVNKTRTVQQVRTVTRVKNVTKNRYVKNITRIVTRTVIVPITRINTITRVHNHTFILTGTESVMGGTTRTTGRTIAGWSRTETINHRPVMGRQCGCG